MEEKIKAIDERTRYLHVFQIAIALMMVGIVSTQSEEYYELVAGFVGTFCMIWLTHQWIVRWRDKTILELYAAVKQPLFEIQLFKDDKYVWQRAEIHRAWLKRSRNELYHEKKIDVIEVYMNDPAIRFTEPTEEYWLRVEDFKRDYLDNWAKKLAPNDENWRKVHLHNQDMQLPKYLQTIGGTA